MGREQSAAVLSRNSEKFGLWTLVFMGTGSVIGAGIVSYVGIAVSYAGRSTWLAYFIAIVLGYLINLPIIFMTSAARIHGGNYSFMATTLGDVWGAYYGIINNISILAFSNFGLALGSYLNVVFPQIPVKVFAVASILAFFGINVLGSAKMAKLQNLLSCVLIVGLLLFGFWGIFYALPDSLDVFQPGYFLKGVDGFYQAIMILMGSTQGYTLISSFSGQSKNAKYNMPLALSIVPLILIVVYCTVGFTMSNVLPVEQTANKPLTAVANILFSKVLYYIFIFAGPVMALATSLNSSFGVFERPLVQVTKDGWLPQSFASQNKAGVSWKFMLVFCVIGIVPILLDFSMVTILSNMTFATSFTYMLLCVGIMRYPSTMEGAWDNRAWKISKGGFYIACVACLGIRIFLIWRSALPANVNMAIFSLTVMVVCYAYCYLRKKNGNVKVTKSWELQ